MSILIIALLIQAMVILVSQDAKVRQFGALFVVPIGIAIAGALAAGMLMQV